MSLSGFLELVQPKSTVPALLHRGDLHGAPVSIPGVAVDMITAASPDGITQLTYERTDWFAKNRRIYLHNPALDAPLQEVT